MMRSRNLKEKRKKRLFRKSVLFKNTAKGFLRSKIHTEKKKYKSLEEIQSTKNTDFFGRFVF